jgi:hypothetical protein
MKPTIAGTTFGSITIDGESYEHDVIIRLSGKVKKREKKLSKEVYGTSHTISAAEAMQVYQESAELLVIGSVQYGMVKLSDEAASFLQKQHCRVVLLPTGKAATAYNDAKGAVVGLFHVTC